MLLDFRSMTPMSIMPSPACNACCGSTPTITCNGCMPAATLTLTVTLVSGTCTKWPGTYTLRFVAGDNVLGSGINGAWDNGPQGVFTCPTFDFGCSNVPNWDMRIQCNFNNMFFHPTLPDVNVCGPPLNVQWNNFQDQSGACPGAFLNFRISG
jgi:hypothetical protein